MSCVWSSPPGLRTVQAVLFCGLLLSVSPSGAQPIDAQPLRSGRSASTQSPAAAQPDRLRRHYLNVRPSLPPASLHRFSDASTALPTASERWRAFRSELTSPGLLFDTVGAALGDHLDDEPASWRGDAIGYAARVGSNTGGMLIEVGTTHGLAAALRLDVRFTPRRHGSVRTRLRHALLGVVTAHTAEGTRVPSAPRLLGSYGAALAQQRWEQGRMHPGDAALSAALSIGIDMAVNVFLEFTADD